MNLPFDYSRCVGMDNWATKEVGEPHRIDEQCNACRRREPGHPTRQVYLKPAPDVMGVCLHRIAPAAPVSSRRAEAE